MNEYSRSGTRTPFEIRHEVGPRACVVRLEGDVDIGVVPDLRAALDKALEGGCENVVLDFSEVAYADSSALGLLVWLDHRLKPLDGRLVLAGANRDVGRILELSGLVNVAASIAMSATVDGALEGLDLPAMSGVPLWEKDFVMPSSVDHLSQVREGVCAELGPLSFPDSAVFDIKVALGEALANAVRHGSPTGAESTVGVVLRAFEDRVVIEVRDTGVGFDGRHVGSDDPYAPGGRGVMFMRALMDRVEYEKLPSGGTLVRLTKHRARHA